MPGSDAAPESTIEPEDYVVGPLEPEDYVVGPLELAMCGEYGLGGAFWEAYQPNITEHVVLMDLPCPAYDEWIWDLISHQPYVLCLLDAVTMRIGIECIAQYMEDSPIPGLYHLDNVMMQYVEPYLNN